MVITKTHKKRIVVTLIFFAISLIASSAFCATYYVDKDSIGGACNDSNSGTATTTPWCTIHKANTTLVAGDTVYIRAGKYTVGTDTGDTTTRGIKPSNSGTSGNPITYTPYQNEIVNLVGQADNGSTYSTGIWLYYKSHIKIDGKSLGQLNISNMTVGVLIGARSGAVIEGDSSYNEIAYVHVYNTYSNESWRYVWQQNLVNGRSFYNHVHHCKFEKHGWLGTLDSENEGNLFDLGIEGAHTESGRAYYNVIENNEFLHAGHATFGFFGDHNVVRNNYFHNDAWYEINGTFYGYRNMIGNGVTGYVGYNLFEGNRLGHAAPNYTWDGKTGNWGGSGLKLCHPYNILRYNSFFNNSGSPLSLATYRTTDPTVSKADHNYIYNNTFYKNGWYQKLPYSTWIYGGRVDFGYIGDGYWGTMYASVLKNNLFYNNANTYSGSMVWSSGNGSPISYVTDPAKGNVTLANNFNADAGQNTDPLFVNEYVSDPTSWTLPSLNLQSSSPAKDAGTYLTQASNSGSSSTNLTASDARYFQDGNFGTGMTLAWPASVIMAADWICVGTVNNCSQISSVNYDTKKITLSSALTWANGAPIWLYKKSDGAQVLFDSAPDMGAYEYGNDANSYSENPQSPPPTTTVPPTIAVSPTIKDFGTLPINTSSPAQRFTVTTTGGNLNVDAISMTGTDATQFAIQNDSCTGKIIAPETGSCTFDVKFAPSSVGAKAANVAIVDNDSNTSKLIAVNGTGTSQIPAISFSPTSLSFSNVLSGTLSSPQTINVSNNSANFVTISSVSLSGTDANQFSIPAATDYCTGETVAASGNCSFQVIFAPTSGGEKTANVNLTALYYSNPATLPLYGSAVVYQSPVPRIKISKIK